MFNIPRITIGILVALCPLFVIAETPRATEAEGAASAVTPGAATTPVFEAPPACVHEPSAQGERPAAQNEFSPSGSSRWAA